MPDDSWTMDALKEHLEVLLDEREKRWIAYQQATQVALNKAEEAFERRIELLNEFRAQTVLEQARFATIAGLASTEEKLVAQIGRNREEIDGLSRRMDIREGQTIGSRLTGGMLVTVLTLTIALLGVLFVVATYFKP